MIVRELFQAEFEVPNDDGGNTWASQTSARAHEFDATQRVNPSGITGRVLNQTPPGSNKDDQQLACMPTPRRVMSGQTDPSHDWNAEAVAKGFKRLPMPLTSDVPFEPYRDVGGFAERQNLMDRK